MPTIPTNPGPAANQTGNVGYAITLTPPPGTQYTTATLPSAASVAPGVQAYTSDSGLQYSDGAAWHVAGGGGVSSVGLTSTDLTVSGSPVTTSGNITANLANNAVTNAKAAQMAANTIKGNNTAGTANAADLTTAQTKTLLAIASGDVSGLAASATTDTTNATNISSGALPAGRMPALTGDVTTSAGAVATTIAASAVSLAKMANLAANAIVGNNTGSPATPLALTATQVTAMLNAFTTSLAGLAPASGGGTTNFLRADATWAAPAGGSANTPTWVKVGNALTFASFSAAALTNTITLFSLPAGNVLHGLKIKHSTAFSGTSITGYTISVGSAVAGVAGYATAFNVFQATGNRVYQLSSNFAGEDHSGAVNIQVTATSTGANLSAGAAGVVDIWACYASLP